MSDPTPQPQYATSRLSHRTSNGRSKAEWVLVITFALVLVMSSLAFQDWLYTRDEIIEMMAEGNIYKQIAFGGGFIIFLVTMTAAQGSRVATFLVKDRFLVALMLFTAISVIYSELLETSVRKYVFLLMSTAIYVWAGSVMSRAELRVLLARTLEFLIILSIVGVIFVPSLGIATGVNEGAWQGIFPQKNTLGMIAAITLVIFITDRRLRTPRGYSTMALAGLLLAKSESVNSLAAAAVSLLVYTAIAKQGRTSMSRGLTFLLLATAALSALLAFIAIFDVDALALLGKDPTLTGRTHLWQTLMPFLRERLWFGYGYGAFWTPANPSLQEVWKQERWLPLHGHNGFVDVILNIGLIGLLLVVTYVIVSFTRALRLARRSPDGVWAITVLTFCVMLNGLESHILNPQSLFWMLFVLVSQSTLHNGESKERTANNELGAIAGPGKAPIRSVLQSGQR